MIKTLIKIRDSKVRKAHKRKVLASLNILLGQSQVNKGGQMSTLDKKEWDGYIRGVKDCIERVNKI